MPVTWTTIGTVAGLACLTAVIVYGLILGGKIIRDAMEDIRRALGW